MGAFSLLFNIDMTILGARPVNIRLAVAHLYTSTRDNSVPNYQQGSTFSRVCDAFKSEQTDGLKYNMMWESIGDFYASWLSRLTDNEILEQQSIALRMDHKLGPHTITPERMRQSMTQWEQNGWNRYETKRAGKLRACRQWAMPVVGTIGLFLGVQLPMES